MILSKARQRSFWLCITAVFLLPVACKQEHAAQRQSTESETEAPAPIPTFDRDSAYMFVVDQLAFGRRNPGSPGIAACREWMVAKLEQYGATVIRQKFVAHEFGGKEFPSSQTDFPSENIIAQFNPENRTRIVFAAHYDTRAIAEEDPDPAKRSQPIPGADDGGSGVAVLLELARVLHEHPVSLGVDLVFFDAEDQGTRDSEADPNSSSWCLGSQYWSKNLPAQNYKPRFGVLLDMVGSHNAFFNRENVSGLYPQDKDVHQLYIKIWNLATAMGKGRYFQDRTISGIIDDHYFVNKIAGIPMIDIINKSPNDAEGFGKHWHTQQDDIGVIDRNTLGAVGQVMTAVIYRTDQGTF